MAYTFLKLGQSKIGFSISAAVGPKWNNKHDDVMLIQYLFRLLHRHGFYSHSGLRFRMPEIKVDGVYGTTTHYYALVLKAIEMPLDRKNEFAELFPHDYPLTQGQRTLMTILNDRAEATFRNDQYQFIYKNADMPAQLQIALRKKEKELK